MPYVTILVDKCDPGLCEGGRCAARKACPTKAIYQDEPGEVPFVNSGRCNRCVKCIGYCPARAIVPIG
ncbi:MAG: hypothetical protein Q7O66_13390 [Dehalococcoidia bacterium]|nr:hypothetical protein [Dehalococcoidia bacterium]